MQTIGEEFQINTYPVGEFPYVSTTLLSNGNLVVKWRYVKDDNFSYDIYAQIFDSNGSAIGNDFLVNTYNRTYVSSESVTELTNGNFIITWLSDEDEDSGYDIYAQIFAPNGSAISNEFLVNIDNDSLARNQSITPLTDGNFIIQWSSISQVNESQGLIHGQKFDSFGNFIGDKFLIYTLENRSESSDVHALGSFFIHELNVNTLLAIVEEVNGHYTSGYYYTLYGQLLDENGNSVDDKFSFAEIGELESSDPLNNNNIIMVETRQYFGMYSAGSMSIDIIYQKDDSLFYEVIPANIFECSDDTFSYYGERSSSILSLEEFFFVAWESHGVMSYSEIPTPYPSQRLSDNGNILGQLFRADGSPITDQIPIAYNTNLNEFSPTAIRINDEQIIVFWYIGDEDGYKSGVYGGQLLDLNGNLIGRQFEINFATEPVSYSSIATLGDGNIMIIWGSEDSSDGGIYGQIFNSQNNAPMANNDNYSIDENTTLTVTIDEGILANDTDADVNPLTVGIETEPSHGSLILNSDGSFEYIPDVDFFGEDIFTYKVSDGLVDSNVANVTITVNLIEDEAILNDSLFRFQNRDRLGTYLFAGQEESENIRANYPNFVEEGFAFNVSFEQQDDLIRFNRFQNSDVPGTYLYATQEESQSIRDNYPNFIEEGIAFYAYGADANKGVDYYRFQNTQEVGTYIFVGEEEKNNITAHYPQFSLEGVAFEVNV